MVFLQSLIIYIVIWQKKLKINLSLLEKITTILVQVSQSLDRLWSWWGHSEAYILSKPRLGPIGSKGWRLSSMWNLSPQAQSHKLLLQAMGQLSILHKQIHVCSGNVKGFCLFEFFANEKANQKQKVWKLAFCKFWIF